MGVPDYWVVDPVGPGLVAFRLDEVTGTDAFEAEHPFAVRVVPADLLGWLADR